MTKDAQIIWNFLPSTFKDWEKYKKLNVGKKLPETLAYDMAFMIGCNVATKNKGIRGYIKSHSNAIIHKQKS